LEHKEKNILIILGPTAVGKSRTAIKTAQELNGEIINCDSMQVYKGFDIGTDKISIEKREGILHHLLDIAEPSEQFTAADFVRHSLAAIESISKQKKLPIITGGTGLYLKALIEGLFPEEKKDPKSRKHLEKTAENEGLKILWEKLEAVDPLYAQKIGPNDRIRIIRALEVYETTGIPFSKHFAATDSFVKDFNTVKIGLKLERSILVKRIEQRVDRMFKQGIVKEVQGLLAKGVNRNSAPFRALGYKHILDHIKKEISLEEAIELTKIETRQYAKRQMTWFNKMEGITWFHPDNFTPILHFIKKRLKIQVNNDREN
jgi:tRNA dimethylallyltransferase